MSEQFHRVSFGLPGPAFRPERAHRWLLETAGSDPSGRVLSWYNPRHPGYDYPEAAAMWLRWACRCASLESERREVVAGRLASTIRDQQGLGRGGRRYFFDSALALAALLDHLADGGDPASYEAVNLLVETLVEFADRDLAVDPAADGTERRWSDSPGPHLLKAAIAIDNCPQSVLPPAARDALTRWLLRGESRRDGGRFLTAPGLKPTYVHAHCYALEGLMYLEHRELTPLLALREGANWLAGIQASDGSLPAWHDGARPGAERRSDSTAQAVRIWCYVDRVRYAHHVDLGLSFLATQQAPCGGVYYEAGGRDVNTWSTLFATQAATWASGDIRPESLI